MLSNYEPLLASTKASSLISQGYGDLLAPMHLLEEYWEALSLEVDPKLMPPKSCWGTTIPYTLWGDEGTLNTKSWMYVTWSLG